MRFSLAIAVAGLGLSSAWAASPEADYLAAHAKARDAYTKLSLERGDPAARKFGKTVTADLVRRLQAMIGPVAVKGFSLTPGLNLDSLVSDQPGDGRIEGLAFPVTPANPDGSKLLVTTKAMFAEWSKGRQADDGTTRGRIPQKLEDALRAELFYTWGVAEDAAFGRAAEIEIEKPAGVEFAYAMLGRWSQEEGPSRVDRLEVAVVKGARVLVADMPAALKGGETPACKAAWEASRGRYKALQDADEKAAEKDNKLDEKLTALSETGTREWLACEGKTAKANAGFSRLKAQAQELAARMAGG